MKRYLAFSYDNYYPLGGWGDFRGDFDTVAAAREALKTDRRDCHEIIDTETMREVVE